MQKADSKKRTYNRFKKKIIKKIFFSFFSYAIAPIWISGDTIPQEKDVPDCPPRCLETIGVPAERRGRSVDWGVLTILTCAEAVGMGGHQLHRGMGLGARYSRSTLKTMA
ncbi:unnamed protein product [Nyctereutes procyonoides]|uniref:(raccoon dog) hypothetical protein n=1 Tax=Nyctereutes procyonoides TaxID=34880 RepID=A0A811YJD1_NYCPR|nr:unnamed protein product [Nyctereutes procyonoides]